MMSLSVFKGHFHCSQFVKSLLIHHLSYFLMIPPYNIICIMNAISEELTAHFMKFECPLMSSNAVW